MSKPTIISVCGDPGGANAVAPVIRMLGLENQACMLNYAYNEGVAVLHRYGISSRLLPQQPNVEWALRQLEANRASLLLTGTSHNGVNWEKFFISAARRVGIHSVAVLDFWGNYAIRFSDNHGNLRFMPDTLAVMDERARMEAVAVGLPVERIIVTGQPAFDSLAECRWQFSPERRSALRQSLDLPDGGLLVMFASQPLCRLHDTSDAQIRYPGFDEESVLAELICSLEAISRQYGTFITLLIRPHPRETVAEYQHYASERISIRVSMEGESREYAMASDLVVGMNSVLLVEACYLGCLVVSLQPGLEKADALPTNAWGVSRGVYRLEEVRPAIETMLLDEKERSSALSRVHSMELDAGAAQRVVGRINSIFASMH